jgi:hypothetical protein
MSTNVWPEFELVQNPPSPKTIIEELGAGLRERTKGAVQFYPGKTTIVGDEVKLSFNLYVPNLRYMFPFMQAKFSLQNSYPVTLTPDKIDEITVSNEEELRAALTRIFTAPTTVETVHKLMSLASNG